ncbi:MAG: DUF3488 domain-containing protein, partial [Acidobacteria bacterium]|nr:DUF3488 domain-containing protein [Acidobacteriota bacterium]
MKPSRDRQGAVDSFFEFSLLGLVASGYLAVAGSGCLDTVTAILAGAALVLRALLVAGVLRLRITDRMVAAATIVYVAFFPLDYFLLSREFLPATVHLVFFVCIAKVLTAKTRRDYLLVKVIAFLELLAASVLSSNLNFFLFLALFLLFGVATFASSEIRRPARRDMAVARGGMRRFGWRLTALTLVIAAGILTMTGGLFFLLPRTARAAFRHLVSERYHLPGFSNEVVLGQIGEIKQLNTPVMRVRIYGAARERPLKWRGAALSQFDGKRWYNPRGPVQALKVEHGVLRLADDWQRWQSGVRVNYEVQLKDIGADALFFAGVPEFVAIPVPTVQRTPTDSFRLGYGTAEGVRYGAYSLLESDGGPPAPPLAEQVRNEYLLLPDIDRRIIALAREVTAGLQSETDRAAAIETYLKRNYAYTLELPAQAPADPLADFLFARRKGHCEYFASAMAVMLRAVWVPARVATGFQSGVLNPVTGWRLIRASDAHSWVEAFLPGAGWQTYDPTPPDPSPAAPSLLSRLGLYVDAAETFWQEWVLDYDLERQMVLAYRMEESSRKLRLPRVDRLMGWWRQARGEAAAWTRLHAGRLAVLLAASVLLALFGPKLWRWLRVRQRVNRLRRGRIEVSDATLLYRRMLRLLKARGIEKPAWLTPIEFVQLLPPSETAALAHELTAAYNELRFGGKLESAARMRSL